MPHKERSDMKMRNQIDNVIPKEFLRVIDSVIAHKLTCASDLLSVRRVYRAAEKRSPMNFTNTLIGGCHMYICDELEKFGGVLSEDFHNSTGRTTMGKKYRARAVYKMR